MKFVEFGDAPERDLGANPVDSAAVQRTNRHRVATEFFVDHVHRPAECQPARFACQRIIGIEMCE